MKEYPLRQLEEPVLESYPVTHEDLTKKLDVAVMEIAEFTDDRGEIQKLPVTLIPGDGVSKETIIINTPWSDSAHRDFNVLRHAALAKHTGADVIIVGFPGHDEHIEGGLTTAQREQLTSKDMASFSEVGKALAYAVDHISRVCRMGRGYWKDREVTLAGYSQGASSQLGMLEHLDETIAKNITDIFIWESPDKLSKQSKGVLAGKFILDGLKAGKYFKENETVFGQEQSRVLGINDRGLKGVTELANRFKPKDKRAELIGGGADAIANSTLRRDLEAVDERLEGKRIHVVNGGNSLVSPVEQGLELIEAIIKSTLPAEINHFSRAGDSHPAQESFSRYTGTIKEAKEK